MKSKTMPLEEFMKIFQKYDSAADAYLQLAYKRMCLTKELALKGFDSDKKLKILDIGSHMLHSSVLYALNGLSVDAADLTSYASDKIVQGILKDFKINLITYNELSNPTELNQLPADSYDIILFTEVLEHITFNPVKMWEVIYRLVSPEGKIIVTTPNFHYCGNLFHDFLRIVRGMSSGISVKDIISLHTTGHHWKLYSVKDIKKYFRLLSPDFCVNRIHYYNYAPIKTFHGRITRAIGQRIKFLREALYAEITIKKKEHGIIAKPGWN